MPGPAPAPTVVLQPVVDLLTGSIVGVEALSRFAGRPCPEQVFAEARAAGRGVALERRALRAALALLPVLPAPTHLAVNLSPAALLDPQVRADVLAAEPGRTVVELTEHEVVEDYTALLTAVAELRRHGVRLAVDDTGAGYSSLRHVLRLTPEVVKLDRCLVAGLARSSSQYALVRGLVTMCGVTGTVVVAEGVEDPADVLVLLELGVACGQGWYLGRPAGADRVAAAITAQPEPPDGFTTLLVPRRPADLQDRLARARQRTSQLRDRSTSARRASSRPVAGSRTVLRLDPPAEPGGAAVSGPAGARRG